MKANAQQFADAMQENTADFYAGRIDYAEMTALNDETWEAVREARVVPEVEAILRARKPEGWA